jgi:hypothetical protein
MPTIFISHASEDRGFVERQVVPFLNAHGLRAWYSKEIPTGAHWESAIREGLQSCDWFLVVVSPRALQSEWVRAEVDWAIENRWERLVPVIIENGDPGEIHLRLRLVQRFDWHGMDADAKQGLLRLWKVDPIGDDSSPPVPSPNVKYDDYLYARPKNWFCIFCGWKCDESFNDYMCKQCDQLRPFAGGQATMVKCNACEGFSLVVAKHCEWCGNKLGATT